MKFNDNCSGKNISFANNSSDLNKNVVYRRQMRENRFENEVNLDSKHH